MKDGWIYTFVVKDNGNFDDFNKLTYHCGEYEDGYIFISRIKDNQIRVLCYSVTRRQAEKLMIKLNGFKLRVLDKFTFDIVIDFFIS